MGLTLAKCPACGAELNLETDKDYFYCPHCGSKVLRQEERIVVEHVIRTVDEAKVKKAELKQAKIEQKTERERIDAETRKAAMPVFAIMMVVLVLMLLMEMKMPPIVTVSLIAVLGLLGYAALKQNKK